MLIEHPSITPLMPFVTSAFKNALESIGENKDKFKTNAIEHYSYEIFNRVVEIQNSLSKIELAIEYLSQVNHPKSTYNFSEHYSYHVERLIIEVFSITDRCWSLIGSSLLLKKEEIEKLGSKRLIKNQLKSFLDIEHSLKKIEIIAKPYRKIRNDIAHNRSYSNKYLTYISQSESDSSNKEIKLLMEKIDLKKLLNIEITKEFKALYESLNSSIIELLNTLTPLYSEVSEKQSQ